MPSRPDIGVPQHCLGCNRAFCGPYWCAQGVDANDYEIICNQQTFRPISEHTISRIPESIHQNNQYENDARVTKRCIQQTGKTLQAVISEWIFEFNNREIDRSRLQLNHSETLTSRTHLCNGCYTKLVDFLLYWFRITMPKSHLPSDFLLVWLYASNSTPQQRTWSEKEPCLPSNERQPQSLAISPADSRSSVQKKKSMNPCIMA